MLALLRAGRAGGATQRAKIAPAMTWEFTPDGNARQVPIKGPQQEVLL
jgi:hypothetical protein